MLERDQAQAELKKIENKEWVAARVSDAEGLAGELRDTARTILGAKDETQPKAGQDKAKQQQDVVKAFLGMDVTARLKFFEAMAPGLGAPIERGWQLIDRLPYQSGYARKPFRAPGHPETLIGRRVNWLLALLRVIGPYQQNVAWFAAWAPHLTLYTGAEHLGILLAAAIDHGDKEGEEVFQILCTSGRNEHEIGGMGRHVTRALLSANRPEGWQFIEGMLLAAQREEGLRQVILETVDESHPQAFRRMLKLILDQNLSRFSATVRAFDVWLGYQWDAASTGGVNKAIEKMLLYLEDNTARDAALKGDESEQAYLALWSHAFDDAVKAVVPATELLKHANPEHRFVATHLLAQLGLLMSQRNLLGALEDKDLRVTTRALQVFQNGSDPRVKKADLFERLEKLLPRYPDKLEKLKPAVWPWTASEVSKESVATALPHNLGDRPPTRLIPHLQHMGTGSRALVIGLLARQEKWDTATRDTLFALVGDPSRQVREGALQHLVKCQITPEEAGGIEQLLDRKTGDLRRGALTLLARQPDEQVLASVDRLLSASSQPQRLAGLELLRQLVETQRCPDEARNRARVYSDSHPKLNEAERQQIDVVLTEGIEVPKLTDGLGLFRHEERTWPAAPVSRGVQFHSSAAREIVTVLNELVKANAQTVVSFKKPSGEEWKGMLSDLNYGFPNPDPKKPAVEDREHLPLADVWENWERSRGPELRDPDGMELLRALAWWTVSVRTHRAQIFSEATKMVFGEIPNEKKEHHWGVRSVLYWLLRLQPPANGATFALDAAESALALLPKDALYLTDAEAAKLEELKRLNGVVTGSNWQLMQQVQIAIQTKINWRADDSPFGIWLNSAKDIFTYAPQTWNPALHSRHWQLLRWMDEPVRPNEYGGNSGIGLGRCLPRDRASLNFLCLAREAGGSTDTDLIEQLIGERDTSGYGRHHFRELGIVTKRKLPFELGHFEFLPPLAERCRKRILEIELTRGDNPTAASALALSLGSVEGTANLVAILRTLGKRNFVRGWARDNQSMETVLSHLARCCFPLTGETPDDFAQQMKAAKIREERLVELAVYAPQWAKLVEHALGWDSLTEAVWWIHAHTKGTDWTVDRDIRELWKQT